MSLSTLLPTKNKFFVKRSFQRLNTFAIYYLRADSQMIMLLETDNETEANYIATALNTGAPRSHNQIQSEIVHWINTARRDDGTINEYIIGLIRGLLWANGFDALPAMDMAEGIVTLIKKAV
jgi:hypothetical protein